MIATTHGRLKIVIIVVVAGLWLAVNLLTLNAYPPVTCDEVSYSSPAAQFLQSGYWGTQTDAGRDGLDKNAVALGRLFLGSIAISFKIWGQSLFAARLVSVVAWALAILGSFILGRQLYGTTVGQLSAALVAVSWIPLLQGHVARPDMALASGVVWAALGLCQALENPSMRRLIGVGLAVGVLLEIHLNGLHFIVAAGLLIATATVRRRWKWQWPAGFGLGVLMAGMLWMSLHVWLAPPVSIGGQPVLSILQNPLSILRQLQQLAALPQFLIQYYLWGGGPGLFTGAIIILGLGVAVWQRTSSDERLIGFTTLSLLSFGIFSPSKPAYYTIVWVPVLMVFGARGLIMLSSVLRSSFLPTPAARNRLIGAVVIGAYLVGDTYLLFKFSDNEFNRISSELQDVIEPGAVVLGNPRAWFALPNRTIIDDFQLAIVSARSPHAITPEDVHRLLATVYKPDYLLLGPHLACFASPTREAELLRQAAEENCQLVTIISEDQYEPNRLYRCQFGTISN